MMSGTYRRYRVGHLLVRGLEMLGADPRSSAAGPPSTASPRGRPKLVVGGLVVSRADQQDRHLGAW